MESWGEIKKILSYFIELPKTEKYLLFIDDIDRYLPYWNKDTLKQISNQGIKIIGTLREKSSIANLAQIEEDLDEITDSFDLFPYADDISESESESLKKFCLERNLSYAKGTTVGESLTNYSVLRKKYGDLNIEIRFILGMIKINYDF